MMSGLKTYIKQKPKVENARTMMPRNDERNARRRGKNSGVIVMYPLQQQSRHRCGRGEASPGADVAAMSRGIHWDRIAAFPLLPARGRAAERARAKAKQRAWLALEASGAGPCRSAGVPAASTKWCVTCTAYSVEKAIYTVEPKLSPSRYTRTHTHTHTHAQHGSDAAGDAPTDRAHDAARSTVVHLASECWASNPRSVKPPRVSQSECHMPAYVSSGEKGT